MRFARIVFWISGIYGLLVTAPLFFLRGAIDKSAPPAVTHPEFYYGFAVVTLMWQVVYLIIAADPARYRILILPGVATKIGYFLAVAILHINGMVRKDRVIFGSIDLLLAVLFLIAYTRIGAGRDAHHLRRG